MKPTRGYGLLEKCLALKRAQVADSLIEPNRRSGRILDVGCGSHPLFLERTKFKEKCGLDPMADTAGFPQLSLVRRSALQSGRLPYNDGSFDVVTMLAVIEHVTPEEAKALLLETARVLKQGGLLIVTTPASWSDRLLRIMAGLRLVSRVEIEEHKCAYDRGTLRGLMLGTGFKEVEVGLFEAFLNIWARGVRG